MLSADSGLIHLLMELYQIHSCSHCLTDRQITAAQCQLRRALRCHGPAAQHQQTAHGARLCPARGGILPDALPAPTRQRLASIRG